MASVRNQQNRLWNRLKILYSIFTLFGVGLSVFVPLASKTAPKVPFGAFKSSFYGLGSTAPPSKCVFSDNKKSPNIRALSVTDLYCSIFLACLEGFEPPTYWFVASHSIQLSYKHIFYCSSPDDFNIISRIHTYVNTKIQKQHIALIIVYTVDKTDGLLKDEKSAWQSGTNLI